MRKTLSDATGFDYDKPMLTLDHIVVTASDLALGVTETEAQLGEPLLPGGEHTAMGTHNRLLALGSEVYLELIAINPAGAAPGQPRWYNLDKRGPGSGLTHWAARCDDLDATLALAPPGSGMPWTLERGDLRWKMAVPETGQTPFEGLFPALIEWTKPVHPARLLADTGVRLRELCLVSPEADALHRALDPLLNDARIRIVAGDTSKMQAILATPRGEMIL